MSSPPPTAPRRRRWYQFGIGTMLLLVAAVAIFIAYHVNWIRQRHVIKGAVAGANIQYFFDLADDPFGSDEPLPPPRAPGLLFLFGEHGYRDLLVVFGAEAIGSSEWWKDRALTPPEHAEVDRLKRLYPEANVRAQGVEKSSAPGQQMPLD